MLTPNDFSAKFEKLALPDYKVYSFADVIQERLSKEITVKTPLSRLYANLSAIKKHVITQNQDWCFLVCGPVGSGKSTLALQLALYLDPKFDMATQMIWDMKDWARFNSNELYGNTPFKVMLFDEAVSMLFAREGMHGGNSDLIKWLTKVRACNYFIIFVLPSPWSIDVKVRDERAKTMILTSKNLSQNSHWYSYYGAEQMSVFSGKNEEKAKKLIKIPQKFVKTFRPIYEEQFPRLDYITETEYLKYKKSDYRAFTDELIEKYKTKPK